MGELLTGWTMHPAVRLRGGLRGEPFGTPTGWRRLSTSASVVGRSPARTSSPRPRAVRRRRLGAPPTRALPPGSCSGKGPGSDGIAHSRVRSSPLADRGPLLYVYLTAPEDVCARRRAPSRRSPRASPFPNGAAVAVRARAKHLARLCTVIPGLP